MDEIDDETTDPKPTNKPVFVPSASDAEETIEQEGGDGAGGDVEEAAVGEEADGQLVFSLELADSDLANAVMRPRSARPDRWGAGGRVCSVSDRYGDVPEVPQPLSRQIMGGAGFTARKTPPPVVDISAPSSIGPDLTRHPRPRRTYSAPQRVVTPTAPTEVDDHQGAFGFADFDDRISDQQDVVIKRSDRLMKLAIAAAFVFVALVGVVAVTSRGGDGAPPESLALIAEGNVPTVTEASDLPDSLTYTIDETDNVEGLNRSIDVTLSEPLNPAELETLANQLRGDPKNFERTFMGFVVEGQDDGWYWATVLFDPDMVVRIRK